ncbi:MULTISPECIES: H-NS family nucleoid-associated regulatory protein [unclassified Phaeobacter]|uniref:H-NS histone family protein n=1 Tax=unclassified Phaeobacter TaxID=2621772 RepID=UPI003A8C5DE0
MADINLEKLSLDELKQLEKDVAKAIKSFEARRKEEARAAAEAVAQEMGYSLNELTAVKGGKPVSAPKYRHPENPALTWSGRGRKPKWFIEALDAGKSADDLLIA